MFKKDLHQDTPRLLREEILRYKDTTEEEFGDSDLHEILKAIGFLK